MLELQSLPPQVVLALLLPLVPAAHGLAYPHHPAPRQGPGPGQLQMARCTWWLVATTHYRRLPPILAAFVANLCEEAKKGRTNNCSSPLRAAQGSNLGSCSMYRKWGD